MPKNDGRGLQATELPQKGHLNIRHSLDIRRQKREREREREREIQIVHSASLADEDESVFTFCALLRMAVRQKGESTKSPRSPDHMRPWAALRHL